MPTDEWERGYAAGYHAAHRTDVRDITRDRGKPRPQKKRRKASSYNRKYGAAFKRLAPKYKKKGGGWKKDGFQRCSAAARRAVK